jgi:ribonuclease HI
MLRLPVSLERKLAALFPRAKEREEFIVSTLNKAIDEAATRPVTEEEPALPETIGGTLHLFSDGGSRGNPGQAAVAAILEDPNKGEVLEEYAERIGIETNNVAEYRALIEGLKMTRKFQPSRLICHLDSELVVRQLNGQYQVKMLTLKPYFDEAQRLASEFSDVIFTHIPRADNYRADALVNKVLDELKTMGGGRGIPAKPNQPQLFGRPQAARPSGWQQSDVSGFPPHSHGGEDRWRPR